MCKTRRGHTCVCLSVRENIWTETFIAEKKNDSSNVGLAWRTWVFFHVSAKRNARTLVYTWWTESKQICFWQQRTARRSVKFVNEQLRREMEREWMLMSGSRKSLLFIGPNFSPTARENQPFYRTMITSLIMIRPLRATLFERFDFTSMIWRKECPS